MGDATTVRRKPKANREAFLAAFAAKGCTTEEAQAALLDMPRRSVYRYLNSEVTPLLTTAWDIAARLDVEVEDLWSAA